jgi:predicted small lipoprotein YifL
MVKTLQRMFVVTVSLVIGAALLSGCGRKGDLDPPSTPVEKQNKLSTSNEQSVPDRPFVLDPLL